VTGGVSYRLRGYRDIRQARRYRRAVRLAFATVTFYREQCAAAGIILAEPGPTPVADLPDPPHTLCPFARPWSGAFEPPLWLPRPAALARALRLAGCGGAIPVIEVRDALLDLTHLPGAAPLHRRRRYAVLLPPHALVASPDRRAELNAEALALAGAAGAAWVVGGPDELGRMPELAKTGLRPVYRMPASAAAATGPVDRPVLLYEPPLGYLGALVPDCQGFHLDWRRVHARDRDGTVTFSLLRERRPTLLDIVPSGADGVRVAECRRHGSPVLRAR
jgi:hypothetical protein